MASIDKTYTNSFKEYKEYSDWVKSKTYTFNYGKKTLVVNISNWLYEWEEEDFTCERPIMNTPTWLDKYLYDNCPCKFVRNRLEEVYPKNYLSKIKLGEISEGLEQNRKVVIKNTNRTTLPLTNKGLNHTAWWIQENNTNNFDYSDELDAWVYREDYFPSFTNTMHSKTIKAMVRRLRKMYLPKGLEFRLIGRYIGEEFIIKIK